MTDWGLIKRKLEGEATPEDETRLTTWLAQNEEYALVLEELQLRWQTKDPQFDRHTAFDYLQSRIQEAPRALDEVQVDSGGATKAIPFRREQAWLTLRIAAAITLLLACAYLISEYVQTSPEAQLLTKTTGPGQQSMLTLADGSVVHLHANSSLEYPEQFGKEVRSLTLSGEAYFDVQSDSGRPFIVKTGDVSTRVLGTEFNIRARDQQDITVTVTEGKVNVTERLGSSIDLVAGEQTSYEGGVAPLTSKKVDAGAYTAWRTRKLVFNKVSFTDAVRQIGEIYGVPIDIQDPTANDCLVRGKYENERLVNVLDGLQLVVDFEYVIEDDMQILIHGKGCN